MDKADNRDHVNKGRRKAIRQIALGVGTLAGVSILPETWTRPIIGQIIIPAHAATSGAIVSSMSAEWRQGDATTNTVIVKISGYISPTMAGQTVTVTATPSF